MDHAFWYGSATASTDYTDMFSQRLMGHLPMALHPGPVRKVCVIGLGAGVTAGAMALHGAPEMTVVELERGVLLASRFFETENHHVLDDPAVDVVLDDGMIFLRATRDETKVQSLLEKLVAVAQDEGANIMPVTIELVKAGASMGDIVEKLKTVWGVYRETPVF